MIDRNLLSALKNSKNLLAFSCGVDSTALFFLLMDGKIAFDCAIVNYHTRKESDLEVSYAKELCEKYDKTLYIRDAKLEQSNFEANARKIRYDFFEEVIGKHSYDTLITAHQLNDRLEWFLMQLCKGAGFFELSGMRREEDRDAYRLVRPLLNISKDELQDYIEKLGVKFFIDSSNADRRFLRNRFRADFAAPLIDRYKEGIKRTFAALHSDRDRFQTTTSQKTTKRLTVIDKSAPDAIFQTDLTLKKSGVLPSKAERLKMQKEENFIASRKIAVCFDGAFIWVAPYEKATMIKEFRELCRKLKIPPHIRGYIFNARIDPRSIDIPLSQSPTIGDCFDRL
ncbi:MAG: tRNA lysidine(34) synthetase TilS [Helicobacteraceae bacterium]|jgi:tRNA(Ile)-lysidine synthase|nr:tRNA lysidine(34) synthetase TilS [Helicobacteraceae bacterium]